MDNVVPVSSIRERQKGEKSGVSVRYYVSRHPKPFEHIINEQLRQLWCRNSCGAETVLLHGTQTINLVSLSTNTTMASNPLLGGKSVMRSIETESHATVGIERG